MVRICSYGEEAHVGEEDGGLDNLGQARASLLEDGLGILADLGRLLADGALDQGAIGGQGDLAGAVDGGGGLDGLGLLDCVSLSHVDATLRETVDKDNSRRARGRRGRSW